MAGGIATATGRDRCWEASAKWEMEVARTRLNTPDGKTTEWKSKALRAYQQRTLVAETLIAGAYLAGTKHTPPLSRAHLPPWLRGRQGHGEPGVA